MEETEIEFGNGITQEEEEVEDTTQVDEETKETSEEVDTKEEETEEEETEEKETEEKPTETVKKDSKQQALDFERSKRKQLEKELKELKAEKDKQKLAEEEAQTMSKEKEALKAKLLEGDLIDENIADKLLETLGEDIIKTKLANKRLAEEESFEKDFAELKKDDMFMDADKYKDKIKEFVKKGLTLEQAYGAAIPASRYASLKKDLEIEIEQKLLNGGRKAEAIDIGHAEAKGEEKRTSYTKEEQLIAKETGLDVKDVHKRLRMNTLDEFLNL